MKNNFQQIMEALIAAGSVKGCDGEGRDKGSGK